jgi:predicted CoA-binding protein
MQDMGNGRGKIDFAALFAEIRTIAVVGAKDTPGQPVDMVGRYLIEQGYTIVPVHPVRKTVWGIAAYPSLREVDVAVDMVNLFRAPQHCPGHAREFLDMRPLPKVFWMQLGIFSPEARMILDAVPVTVVEDRCSKIEHMLVKT